MPSTIAPASAAPRPREHRVEHRLGQPAGERVLLADVVAAEQRVVPDSRPRRRGRSAAWAEDRGRAQRRSAASQANPPRQTITRARVSSASSRAKYGRQVSRSAGRRPVGRRRAAHRRRRPSSRVSARPSSRETRLGLVGQPRPPQRREQPVARAVAGEDPPGPVAAVGGRRQAEHDDPRRRVAEARDRPAPVLLIGERGALDPRHLLAPGDQPRTAPAGGDLAAPAPRAPRAPADARGHGRRRGRAP